MAVGVVAGCATTGVLLSVAEVLLGGMTITVDFAGADVGDGGVNSAGALTADPGAATGAAAGFG